MMRLIRQLLGRSYREAQADAMSEAIKNHIDSEERQIRAKRIVLERLVAELQKDTKVWR